jgi:hypothetical protein
MQIIYDYFLMKKKPGYVEGELAKADLFILAPTFQTCNFGGSNLPVGVIPGSVLTKTATSIARQMMATRPALLNNPRFLK